MLCQMQPTFIVEVKKILKIPIQSSRPYQIVKVVQKLATVHVKVLQTISVKAVSMATSRLFNKNKNDNGGTCKLPVYTGTEKWQVLH